MYPVIFYSVAGVGVTVFAKQLYEALSQDRASGDSKHNMLMDDAHDLNVNDSKSVAKDADLISISNESTYGSDADEETLAKGSSNSSEATTYTCVWTQDSIIIEENSPPVTSKALLDKESTALSLTSSGTGTLSLSNKESTLVSLASNLSCFQFPNTSEEHLFYIIFLNMACGLNPTELVDCVRKVTKRSQMALKSKDRSMLEEWIATNKRCCVYRVPNHEKLLHLSKNAKKMNMIRVTYSSEGVVIALGLGPARLRDFREIL